MIRATEPIPPVRVNVDRPQVSADHYSNHAYNTKGRRASYWHQVEETLNLGARRVLEVGAGAGQTAAALRDEGVSVVTLDIDPALRPSAIGSVRRLPFADGAIDAVLCCQVLEHLPFSEFEPCVTELCRVARLGVIVSLPDRERYLRVCLGGEKKTLLRERVIDVPRRASRRPTKLHVQHCWEIGCRDMPLKRVLESITHAAARRPRTYRVFEMPYHRFFVIRK